MFKKIAFASMITAACLTANDIKFYGGIEEYKDEGEKERMKSLDLSGNFYSYGSGVVSNVNLNFSKHDSSKSDIKNTVGLSGAVGYQVGSPSDDTGAIRFMPLGFEITKYKFVGDYVDEDGYLVAYKDGSLIYYKGGAEYQNDNFIARNLYLNLNAYYKVALNSFNITYDTQKFKLKPKGYELSSEIGYAFDSKFLVGLKVGYKNLYDTLYGEKIYFNKGNEYKMSVGYRF